MIARLTVAVPFVMAVPDGADFPLWSSEEDGYGVTLRPPVRSDVPLPSDAPAQVEIDGKRAYLANAVQIDFHKSAFDRSKGGPSDPPEALLRSTVTSLLARLRYTTRATQINAGEPLQGTSWRLEYLNDDGSELAPDPALMRARTSVARRASFVAVSPAIWNAAHQLASAWASPVWDDILLDASGALPSVGTAVVLGATALEVFISHVLDGLAEAGRIPADVWAWLNDRDNWLKEPSTEEQFDVLLKHFTGHTLKDDRPLWQAFKELRTARNTFVHQGRATVGGVAITAERASVLIRSAHQIVQRVREWLPEDQRWPAHSVPVQTKFLVMGPLSKDGKPPDQWLLSDPPAG